MNANRLWKVVVLSGLAGFIVAGALVTYAFYQTSNRNAMQISPMIYVVFCPPSLGLMAIENASITSRILVILWILFANTFYYAFWGTIIRSVAGVIRKGK